MSTIKIVLKEAFDVIEDLVPRAARAVSEKSGKLSAKTRQIKQQIEAKDAELASSQRTPDRAPRHDAPEPGSPSADARTPDPRTVDVELERFNRRADHPIDEFDAQLDEQLTTLQRMPLDRWKQNYDAYHAADGRPSAADRAARNFRAAEIKRMLSENLAAGMDKADALRQAKADVEGLAALHRLDGVAGGDLSDISRMGHLGVNSSLGAQWKDRVGDLRQAVADFEAANPGVDLADVRFSVTFAS